MSQERAGISDDAVRAATGRTPAEWEAQLDARGAADLLHKQIVAQLQELGVERGWWRQMLTVDYERRKGKRALGQTAATGFEIGVRRTLQIPADDAWQLLMSPEGVGAWLGGKGPRWEKGETYTLKDGSAGEVRVFKPGSHLRMTVQPEGWPRASTLQVRVMPSGEEKTVISFHQEHLPGAAEREERRKFFEAALDALQKRVKMG
ncbi:SRPBCC family protein [Longimicrobium sp.]|uniref:SRPBCC family protein n=1 Tax=Longimicrobium sp. TaxID=2029185 RepID=UPI003B3BE570